MAKKLEILSVESEIGVTENGSKLTTEKSIVNFELDAEIVAGTLTTNAKELKKSVESELKNYTVEKYIDNPDAAKSDKALLNKVKDSISNKRKEITKIWNKPLDDFLIEMKSLEDSVQEASNKINDIVKAVDEQEKAKKREQIEQYFSTLDYKIVTLDKIFNIRWLNKTFQLKDIMLEIEQKIEKISTELNTIKSMDDEDKEILQSFYLDTLDLNATLQKGNQLKQNRAKIQAENERQSEEWRNQKLKETGIINTTVPEQKKEAVNSMVNNIMSFTLKLYGTKEQLVALRKYIDANNIKYEKL